MTSWGYSLETDCVLKTEMVDTIDSLITNYPSPSPEVTEQLEIAAQAAVTALSAFALDENYLVVRISGRATENHQVVDGPDELLNISLSVVDVVPTEPPQPLEEVGETAVEVEGGSYRDFE